MLPRFHARAIYPIQDLLYALSSNTQVLPQLLSSITARMPGGTSSRLRMSSARMPRYERCGAALAARFMTRYVRGSAVRSATARPDGFPAELGSFALTYAPWLMPRSTRKAPVMSGRVVRALVRQQPFGL